MVAMTLKNRNRGKPGPSRLQKLQDPGKNFDKNRIPLFVENINFDKTVLGGKIRIVAWNPNVLRK